MSVDWLAWQSGWLAAEAGGGGGVGSLLVPPASLVQQSVWQAGSQAVCWFDTPVVGIILHTFSHSFAALNSFTLCSWRRLQRVCLDWLLL